MSKIALITGITGQDGSYLAEILLNKGYEVHGMIRRSSSFNTDRIEGIFNRVNLHYGDLTDAGNVYSIIDKVRPTEIYNLGAQSHVAVSFDLPAYTTETILMGTLHILEAVRQLRTKQWEPRIYQASSSEMFGSRPGPQNEETPFQPQSPYAVAKVAAHEMAIFYREAYNMFVACGILFNHESPRRGGTFVTQKIVQGLQAIKVAKQEGHLARPLVLGSLWPKRDWGSAGEYMYAAWKMLQHPDADTFVIGTGVSSTVEHFLDLCIQSVGLDADELRCGGLLVTEDPRYVRPAEVDFLLADPTKAREKLKWAATVKLDTLVDMMMNP